jgi:hypothetical protein
MAHVYAVETTPKLTDEDAKYFLRLGDFLTAYETYLSLYGNKAILDSANKPSVFEYKERLLDDPINTLGLTDFAPNMKQHIYQVIKFFCDRPKLRKTSDVENTSLPLSSEPIPQGLETAGGGI